MVTIMMKNYKIFVPFLIAICLFCGCATTRQNVIKINLGAEPHTLNPQLARDPSSQTVMRMLFEGLTRIGREDQPELALANSLEISEDLKTYTFCLRETRWTNGKPLLARDFIYAWKKMLDPDYSSDNAYQLYVLKNGKKIKEGELDVSHLGVVALDEKTLQIELEYPTPYFLELLAAPFFFPICQQLDEGNPKWAEKVETFVSNGPFSLVRHRYSDCLLVIKNPNYWDKAAVAIDQIELSMLDSSIEFKLFEQGKLHWAGAPLSVIPVDALETLKKQEGLLHAVPRAETAFLRTNTEKIPFTQAKLRKALAIALDRSSITTHVLQGGQLPAFGLVPPALKEDRSPYFQDKDLTKALILFEEALAEMGIDKEDLPEVNLLYINTERTHLIAQALQDQWRKAFGIKIGLQATERKVFFDRISRRDYDIAFCSWGADFHDPINFLEVFKYKTQSTNNTGWEDPEYSKELTASFSLSSPKERLSVLASLEKKLIDAMPIIPIFYYSMLYMKDEKLQGVFLSALGNLDFKWAYFENEEQ